MAQFEGFGVDFLGVFDMSTFTEVHEDGLFLLGNEVFVKADGFDALLLYELVDEVDLEGLFDFFEKGDGFFDGLVSSNEVLALLDVLLHSFL